MKYVPVSVTSSRQNHYLIASHQYHATTRDLMVTGPSVIRPMMGNSLPIHDHAECWHHCHLCTFPEDISLFTVPVHTLH